MKLDGWQLAIVILGCVGVLGALGWHGVLDGKSVGTGLVSFLTGLAIQIKQSAKQDQMLPAPDTKPEGTNL